MAGPITTTRMMGTRLNKHEVFLGGTCANSTWRKTAIEILQTATVTFYNPQCDEWTPDLIPKEVAAKASACCLLFVISVESRGVASMVEVCELIASGRKLILCLAPYSHDDDPIDVVQDVNRGRRYLSDAASRFNCPMYEDVPSAAAAAADVVLQMRSARPAPTKLVLTRAASWSGREWQSSREWESSRRATVSAWEQRCPVCPSPAADSSTHVDVSDMLDNEWPQYRNSSLLDTWKIRDEKMRSIGPAMVLIDPLDLERLGRMPKYSEQKFITMTEAHSRAQSKGQRFFIEFFSHRWPDVNQPDDKQNSQAKALVQWSLFRRANGLDVYFWIDYSCMDQDDVLPGVQMLPLYVASSNNILCYDSPDYEERAWCRLERMLFAAFCAPNQDVIRLGFEYSVNQTRVEELWTIQDPEQGILSIPEDMERIAELKILAEAHWGECWKEGLYDIVKDQMRAIENLMYGQTQVRCTIHMNVHVLEQHCPVCPLSPDSSMRVDVRGMLKNEWPQHRNSSLLDTWKIRDEKMRSIGPAMVLIDPQDIERLGRMPKYSEQKFITMTEAHSRAQSKGQRFFIEFFSHRWPEMNQPDNKHNSQAKALVQWSLYRRSYGLDVYFWIDFSCMDQDDVLPGVQMLPLYIASSNNILCYDSPDYEERAWCRLERMLFAAFCAPNQDVIRRGFEYTEFEDQYRVESLWTIQDPEHGVLSIPKDMERIAELKLLAEAHWGECWKEGLYDIVKDQMRAIEHLDYGQTQVRSTRYF